MTINEVVNYGENSGSQLTLAKPVVGASELITYHAEVTKIIKAALQEGVDYGEIPGTKKKILFKPGAERLAIAFGARPEYVLLSSEVDHEKEVFWKKNRKVWRNQFKGDKVYKTEEVDGSSFGLYRYAYACRLVRSDGRVLGEGHAICSSLENKYIETPRDVENTVCKMAQKRAFVAATLNAFGLSDRFSQDLDDHDDVEAVIEAAPANTKRGYDPNDPNHVHKLTEVLIGRGVHANFHEEVSKKMAGLTMDKLDEILKQVG